MGKAHGQGVVTGGGAARPDAKSRADADEQRAHHGSQKGKVRDSRPQGREQLADGVAGGITAGGDGGIGDEGLAQGSPPQNVAGDVQHEAADGGGQPKPVVKQQRCAQHAALGHAGQGVDVVHAEGLQRGAEKSDDTVGCFQFRKFQRHFCGFFSFWVFSGYNIMKNGKSQLSPTQTRFSGAALCRGLPADSGRTDRTGRPSAVPAPDRGGGRFLRRFGKRRFF